jgi:hypothetical protein
MYNYLKNIRRTSAFCLYFLDSLRAFILVPRVSGLNPGIIEDDAFFFCASGAQLLQYVV